MDRRAFISTLAGGLLTAPLAAEAQQTGKVPRVGFLGNSSPELDSEWVTAFRRGLREIGYVEGQNIVIEYRWAEGKRERFADLAAELVRLKVDVIVTGVDRALEAARRSTTTIPIVVATATNPVGLGYVASLSRPGGNITGLSIQTAELPAKRLQLLREAVPKPRLLAALWDPAEPGREGNIREAEAAARSVGVQLRTQRASNPRELEGAFVSMIREGAGAVLVLESQMFGAHKPQIAELALANRLPALYPNRLYVQAGGLMSYGASYGDLYRRSATYVDKVLKGAKPGDLPIEQPTNFELVINLKTAKALGLTIPPSLLLRADHVIE